MPTTPRLKLPYPSPSDANDPPADFQALASAIEANTSARGWSTYRPGTQDDFAAGAWTTVAAVVLPADAPAGQYLASFEAAWSLTASGASVGYVRCMFGSFSLSKDFRVDLVAQAIHTSYTGTYNHAGGAARVELFVQAATATGRVYAAGTAVHAAYLG